MLKIPALLQTEPLGKPALDVGIFFIDRLFTNVAQTCATPVGILPEESEATVGRIRK